MVPVAVVGRSRSSVRALLSACQEAGIASEATKQPIAWSRRPGPRATFLVIRDGVDWEMLAGLAGGPATHRVLAVLEDASTARYIEALKMGAHGVADIDREPHDIVAELPHVLEGTPRIPYAVLRLAVMHAPVTPPFVSTEESQILKWLAEGLTMKAISVRRVEGKRRTEHVLEALQKRLGCHNRFDLILQAERWGLLDDVGPGSAKSGAKDGMNG